MSNTNGFQIEVYQCPEGSKRAGMYTFKINGQDSLFYSTTEAGLNARIEMLFKGKPKGLIELKAVPLNAKPQDSNQIPRIEEKHWSEYETAKERIAAFMQRGKLAKV